MNFAEWLSKQGHWFWEFHDIKDLPTDDIELEPVDLEEFDEDDARSDCEDQVDRYGDFSYCYEDIYDDPEDDPDFKAETPEEWLENNPEPDDHDYEDQEEFKEDLEQWVEDRKQAEEEYKSALKNWKKEMQRRRYSAEECESKARWEQINDCIDEKSREFEEEKARSAQDYRYSFDVDGDNFEVHFSRNDPIKVGNNYISGVWGITFEGPQGVSSTNKGKNQNTIYTKLLLSIKKLLEVEEVNVLQFSPAEPAMGLVYHRFYKMFLAKDFLRTNASSYVRKTVLKEALKGEPAAFKIDIYKKILKAHRDLMQKGRQVKEFKNSQRVLMRKAQSMVGGFVGVKQYDDTYMPGILVNMTYSGGYVVANILVDANELRQVNGELIVPIAEIKNMHPQTWTEYINMLQDMLKGLAGNAWALKNITEKTIQEIRQYLPQIADELLASWGQQKATAQTNPFEEPPQSPKNPGIPPGGGWSYV
jgi:hypothetical protein